MTAAIDRPDLRLDPRFVDRAARVRNHEELVAILGSIFATAPRATWLGRLDARDVPAGPINRLDEVFADPGVRALGLVRTVTHPTAGSMELLGSAVELSGHDDTETAPPPLLGEHTVDVLHELGYNDILIDELRETEVI